MTTDDINRAFVNEYDNDKYNALNTLHSNTYEIRIFRGTLNPTTFYATLQLVDNLVRLAHATDFNALNTITFDDIVNFVHYDELTNYWNLRKGGRK